MERERYNIERFDTIVVGGGQAGLQMGYHLQRRGIPFVILDAGERVGDAWRARWDSMRLFTPARYDGLEGMRFPGGPHAHPTKDAMADYLESYAARFELPVRLGVRVDALSRRGGRFLVSAGPQRFEADRVVVATGAFQTPWIPPFASDLDPGIVQLHSGHYRNPSQLRDGGVLIAGAANSGADIAMEIVTDRATWLSGRHPGHVPFRIDTFKARFLVRIVRFMGQHVLTRRTPIGRRVGPKLKGRGTPLIRVKPRDLLEAGVQRVPRVAGVRDGLPMLEDGRVLDVSNVVWCTGFRRDFSWIDLPVLDERGEPVHRRGVVEREPGLYFLGMLFQFAATSEVITGAGRDARYLLRHMAAHPAARSERAPVKSGAGAG